MEKNIIRDRIRGSLIGGAIGDALGYPVEFMSLAAIRDKYGKDGITNFELDKNSKAVVSDDTQMTLFTANGLMFGVTRWATHGMLADLPSYVQEAYKEWYQTQAKVDDYNAYHTCWIRDIKELNVRRAPGNTCLSALHNINNVNNNSKGCGGIMRVAPVALYLSSENGRFENHGKQAPFSRENIVKYAGDCAAITHKHPLGYLSAAIFADVLYQLLNTEEKVTFDMVCNYVDSALETLMSIYTSKQEATALGELWYISKRAIDLAQKDIEDSAAISELGEGWVAEETWAIALYCVLKHLDSFEDAVVASVNHDGDSDSTGSVCGNLMGVIIGYEGIPEKYKTNIELKNVILALADDMIHGCNISEYHYAETADEKKWERRYIYANPMLKPLFNSYAVTDWLFAGEYPGDKDPSKLREKINQLDLFGITHIFDLTEEGELLPYAQLLPKTIKHHRFPIEDQSVPNSTESVRKLVQEIEEIHKNEQSAKVYIHCWGGVGRTGTIVCCFLASALCATYEDTMSEFKKLWSECPKSKNRISPENNMQLDFVKIYIKQLKEKSNRRYTPDRISELKENEIFVFGSNLAGAHGGGAARLAYDRFGAVWGQGVGLHGQTYAIPTMQGGVETIKPYVDEFIRFAKENVALTFLVTRIGCGIAGFRDEDVAPLFKEALDVENIILPKIFAEAILDENVDKYHLERFVKAQQSAFDTALREIEEGEKRSHWIWYIFPQLAVLGHSHNAKFYGISGYDEAEAYLNHPILGERLRRITQVLLEHKDLSLQDIFGGLDAMKVCSCMTLFDAVSPDDVFNEVLESFDDAKVDKKTLDYM